MIQFGQQVPLPGIGIDGIGDMGVEVAIGTFGNAERPVDVKAEPAGHGAVGGGIGARIGGAIGIPGRRHPPGRQETGGKQASMSFANAAARWLLSCFFTWSISP